ncbi:murein L,D-transpeptidase catalytic domain-containing protein, partial [Ferruginibacter sp.]
MFAKTKPVSIIQPEEKKLEFFVNSESPLVAVSTSHANVYDSLRLNLMGLSQQAFQYAMQGLDHLLKAGKISNDKIISIVDFSQSSNKKRLFVIDLNNYKVVFNTYVAHGVNSGKEFAQQFSNRAESFKSSLGFYETLQTYNGKNG